MRKGLLGLIYYCDTDSSLLGEWTSRLCEARPRSLFLTRELKFRSERKWEARYRFFVDERCNKPHFSVAVAGRFSPGGRSPVVPGGWQLLLLHPQCLTMNISSSYHHHYHTYCDPRWLATQSLPPQRHCHCRVRSDGSRALQLRMRRRPVEGQRGTRPQVWLLCHWSPSTCQHQGACED